MAQPAVPPPGFDELSPDEKLEYIQALWAYFLSILKRCRCPTGIAEWLPNASLHTAAAR